MDTALKNAAILANLSALRMTLAGALERAEDAENAIKLSEVNQAIGAAIGIERTYTAQVEALARLRRGGEQRVIVQHVNVNDGGKAIVGAVNHPGGGG